MKDKLFEQLHHDYPRMVSCSLDQEANQAIVVEAWYGVRQAPIRVDLPSKRPQPKPTYPYLRVVGGTGGR
jgi:hypothetical protein